MKYSRKSGALSCRSAYGGLNMLFFFIYLCSWMQIKCTWNKNLSVLYLLQPVWGEKHKFQSDLSWSDESFPLQGFVSDYPPQPRSLWRISSWEEANGIWSMKPWHDWATRAERSFSLVFILSSLWNQVWLFCRLWLLVTVLVVPQVTSPIHSLALLKVDLWGIDWRTQRSGPRISSWKDFLWGVRFFFWKMKMQRWNGER